MLAAMEMSVTRELELYMYSWAIQITFESCTTRGYFVEYNDTIQIS